VTLDRIDATLAAGIGALALAVYVATLAPGLSHVSPDGAELIVSAATGSLAHPPGYPIYTWMGWLFAQIPVGSVAWRLNLMSAVCAAIAVALVYTCTRSIAGRGPAAVAACLLAFSPTMWSQSVIAEVYTPNLMMVLATTAGLLWWRLHAGVRSAALVGLLFGLSLGTHLSNVLLLPAFAAVALVPPRPAVRGWGQAATMAGGALLGMLQFAWLPLRTHTIGPGIPERPDSLAGLWAYTFGAYADERFAYPLAELPERLALIGAIGWNQLGIALVPGALGAIILGRRHPWHAAAPVLAITVPVLFFAQYRAPDLEVFLLPATAATVALAAVAVDAGIALVDEWRTQLSVAVVAVALVAAAPGWTAMDRSGDVAVDDFYANLWEFLPAGATLHSRSDIRAYDLFYGQLVEHRRPDVLLPALTNRRPELGTPEFSLAPTRDARRVMVGTPAPPGGGPHRPLSLYQISPPPEPPGPPDTVDIRLGSARLTGFSVPMSSVRAGGRLRVALHWTLEREGRQVVGLRLGTTLVDVHALHGPGGAIDQIDVVVPSTTLPGVHTLGVGHPDRPAVTALIDVTVTEPL
jgi:hypothetical protein